MSDEFLFTDRGLEKLDKEIQDLKNKISDLQSQIANAAEVGGDQWHDNFAYESLTQEIRGIDHRLLEKQKTLRNSVLVDPPKSFDKVVIGARVKIIHNGKLMTWDIVGFGESDPSNNMIAYNTRLALLIMGKRKGQVVKEELNGQKTEIEILEIMEGEKNADNS